MYALSQYQIESNKVTSLNNQCSKLERNIVALANRYELEVPHFKDRSKLLKADLDEFVKANPDATHIMDTWGDPNRTSHATSVNTYQSEIQKYLSYLKEERGVLDEKCAIIKIKEQLGPLAQEISSICAFCGIEDRAVSADKKGLKELQAIQSKYAIELPELRQKKRERVKQIVEERARAIEKKIQDEIGGYEVIDTLDLSSATKPKKSIPVKHTVWDLQKNKDLVVARLEILRDGSFVEKYGRELENISGQLDYDRWLNQLKAQEEFEKLIDIYREMQEKLSEGLSSVPDGPTKNTLTCEIANLTDRNSWRGDYRSWKNYLNKKAGLISAYINKYKDLQDEKNYVVDTVLEVLVAHGSLLDSRNYISGQGMNVVSASLGNSSYVDTIAGGQQTESIEDLERELVRKAQQAKQREYTRKQNLESANQLVRSL